MPNEPKRDNSKIEPQKPADLAEGDLATVEESIRIHEEKGDLQKVPADSKPGKKDAA